MQQNAEKQGNTGMVNRLQLYLYIMLLSISYSKM